MTKQKAQQIEPEYTPEYFDCISLRCSSMTIHACILRQNNPDTDYKFCRSCSQGKEIAARAGVEIVKRCKCCGAKIRHTKLWARPDDACQSCIEKSKVKKKRIKYGEDDE